MFLIQIRIIFYVGMNTQIIILSNKAVEYRYINYTLEENIKNQPTNQVFWKVKKLL